jgi:hypothetical protein
MAQKSSIEQLPQELFDEINRALRTKTIDEVVAHMAQLGAELSRSAVGRHKRKVEEVAARLKNSRIVAEAIGKELGDSTDDKLAALNIELLHDQVMKIMSGGEDGVEVTMEPKELRLMADALFRLAAARKLDVERIVKVRQETAKAAAQVVEKTLKTEAPGLSPSTVASIREKVLGVAG